MEEKKPHGYFIVQYNPAGRGYKPWCEVPGRCGFYDDLEGARKRRAEWDSEHWSLDGWESRIVDRQFSAPHPDFPNDGEDVDYPVDTEPTSAWLACKAANELSMLVYESNMGQPEREELWRTLRDSDPKTLHAKLTKWIGEWNAATFLKEAGR